MRTSTIVMIGFAVLFGLLAVFLAQTWLNNQAEQSRKNLEAQKKNPTPSRVIVVASKPLRFGNELSPLSLRELPWPDDALPAGSFGSIKELTSTKRVVLTPIETNEPILASKITGSGQRATLSAVIKDGMKAITIRVNDVEGVAGFVLPGDRVDVVLTRQGDKQGDKTTAMNDVVIQNVRVLAVDQIADERSEKPSVVKAVTLEVDETDGQKLALSASVGTLGLLLRKSGEVAMSPARRVTLTDLNGGGAASADSKFATVVVTRALTSRAYSVPVEGRGSHSVAASAPALANN